MHYFVEALPEKKLHLSKKRKAEERKKNVMHRFFSSFFDLGFVWCFRRSDFIVSNLELVLVFVLLVRKIVRDWRTSMFVSVYLCNRLLQCKPTVFHVAMETRGKQQQVAFEARSFDAADGSSTVCEVSQSDCDNCCCCCCCLDCLLLRTQNKQTSAAVLGHASSPETTQGKSRNRRARVSMLAKERGWPEEVMWPLSFDTCEVTTNFLFYFCLQNIFCNVEFDVFVDWFKEGQTSL